MGRLTAEVYVGEGFIDAADGYVDELADTARRARDAEVWVAAEGEQVLGSVTFCPLGSPFREIARDDEGEFRMLAVNDAARGRGVGQALVSLCVLRSRELGYAGVRMSSMDRDDLGAPRLRAARLRARTRGRLVTRCGRHAARLRGQVRGRHRPRPRGWTPRVRLAYVLPTRDMNRSASTSTRVTSPDPTSLPS